MSSELIAAGKAAAATVGLIWAGSVSVSYWESRKLKKLPAWKKFEREGNREDERMVQEMLDLYDEIDKLQEKQDRTKSEAAVRKTQDEIDDKFAEIAALEHDRKVAKKNRKLDGKKLLIEMKANRVKGKAARKIASKKAANTA